MPTREVADPAARPASPARQVGAAVVHLGTGRDGGQHVSVRLNPHELGVVHVRIERAPDGTAAVQVAAERPDTLHLLQADRHGLQVALAQAGLPPASPVSFTLAAPDAGSGSGAGAAGTGTGGGSQPGRQDRPPPRSWAGPFATAPDPSRGTAWLQAGVDILA